MTKTVDLGTLIIEQQEKILSECSYVDCQGRPHGGFKYGHDYNILKAILKHIEDVPLVENLIDSLEDENLRKQLRNT